jgi:hypothetical protein
MYEFEAVTSDRSYSHGRERLSPFADKLLLWCQAMTTEDSQGIESFGGWFARRREEREIGYQLQQCYHCLDSHFSYIRRKGLLQLLYYLSSVIYAPNLKAFSIAQNEPNNCVSQQILSRILQRYTGEPHTLEEREVQLALYILELLFCIHQPSKLLFSEQQGLQVQ